MKDMASQLKCETLITPAVRTTDNTVIWVDTRGYDSKTVQLILGAGGITFDDSNKIDFELYESDDNGSTSNLVPLADILGDTGASAGIIRSLTVAQAADTYMYAYIGSKRYLGLSSNFTGTHGTGTAMAATVILGHPRNSPLSN